MRRRCCPPGTGRTQANSAPRPPPPASPAFRIARPPPKPAGSHPPRGRGGTAPLPAREGAPHGRAGHRPPIRADRRSDPRPLGNPGGEQQVSLQAGGGGSLVGDEVRHRHAQALADEGQRRHRRLGQSSLESADVGRGVSTRRHLRLGQSGAHSCLANAIPDATRHMAVVDDDDLARPGARCAHCRTIRHSTIARGHPTIARHAAPPDTRPRRG